MQGRGRDFAEVQRVGQWRGGEGRRGRAADLPEGEAWQLGGERSGTALFFPGSLRLEIDEGSRPNLDRLHQGTVVGAAGVVGQPRRQVFTRSAGENSDQLMHLQADCHWGQYVRAWHGDGAVEQKRGVLY
jgi:hypothetical protein